MIYLFSTSMAWTHFAETGAREGTGSSGEAQQSRRVSTNAGLGDIHATLSLINFGGSNDKIFVDPLPPFETSLSNRLIILNGTPRKWRYLTLSLLCRFGGRVASRSVSSRHRKRFRLTSSKRAMSLFFVSELVSDSVVEVLSF